MREVTGRARAIFGCRTKLFDGVIEFSYDTGICVVKDVNNGSCGLSHKLQRLIALLSIGELSDNRNLNTLLE